MAGRRGKRAAADLEQTATAPVEEYDYVPAGDPLGEAATALGYAVLGVNAEQAIDDYTLPESGGGHQDGDAPDPIAVASDLESQVLVGEVGQDVAEQAWQGAWQDVAERVAVELEDAHGRGDHEEDADLICPRCKAAHPVVTQDAAESEVEQAADESYALAAVTLEQHDAGLHAVDPDPGCSKCLVATWDYDDEQARQDDVTLTLAPDALTGDPADLASPSDKDAGVPVDPGAFSVDADRLTGAVLVERTFKHDRVDSEPIASRVTDETGRHIATVVSEPALPGVRTDDGYALPADLSFERWSEIVGYLQTAQTSVNWWLGDAIVYGLDHFGDAAYQAIADQAMLALGRSDEWIDQIAQVARSFPPELRVAGVRWSHHRAVMLRELPSGERLSVLREAAEEGLSTRETAERARGRANVLNGDVIDAPPADPNPFNSLSGTDSDGVDPNVPPEWQDGPETSDEKILLGAAAWRQQASFTLSAFRTFTFKLLVKHRKGDDLGHLYTCPAGRKGAPCTEECEQARSLLARADALLDGLSA